MRLSQKLPSLLYGSTIFLSAYLVFVIQPMLGKKILPWFGGTSGVWNTVMLFFITTLIAGYAYAYFLSRLLPAAQKRVHRIVSLCTIALFIVLWLALGDSPITPSVALVHSSAYPVLSILFMLLLCIGIPYAFLSSTSTLLQAWFTAETGTAPYRLYSVSNVGSLLGVLSYPFVIEPLLTVRAQLILWSIGFLAVLSLLILISLRKKTAQTNTQSENGPRPHQSYRTYLRWFLLGAIPSALLLAATERITTSIAPVPFLWLVPLGAYLVAFVIAWLGLRRIDAKLVSLVLLWSAFMMLIVDKQSLSGLTMIATVLLIVFVLFLFCFLYAHILYRSRPEPQGLSAFYLMIALGGAFGALLISVVAPLLFRDYAEFSLLFSLAALLPLWEIFKGLARTKRQIVSLTCALALFLLMFGTALVSHKDPTILFAFRNFYGTLAIRSITGEDGETFLALSNGGIRHGTQFLDAQKSKLPTTYYTEETGVGLVLEALQKKHEALTVGVVGLGTGTLAAYCRPSDRYTFYDINPAVVAIAKGWFSYLSFCKESIVTLGDARLSLEEEHRQGSPLFDLLVLDAFSDDAIPVHLLTKEALELYLDRTKINGVIALHISNRYLDLAPVIAATAEGLGLQRVLIHASAERFPERTSTSIWVLLSREEALFATPTIAEAKSPLEKGHARGWTDQFSNLFYALKI